MALHMLVPIRHQRLPARTQPALLPVAQLVLVPMVQRVPEPTAKLESAMMARLALAMMVRLVLVLMARLVLALKPWSELVMSTLPGPLPKSWWESPVIAFRDFATRAPPQLMLPAQPELAPRMPPAQHEARRMTLPGVAWDRWRLGPCGVCAAYLSSGFRWVVARGGNLNRMFRYLKSS